MLIRATHETLNLLSCCVFIEMVNWLNIIILKSFLIIVFTSILHLFYRTIIPPTICTTLIFFINRILDPITSDVMNNVTYPRDNTRQIQEIKLQQNKTKKTLKMISCRVIPKVSPYTLSKFTQIFLWAMAFYSASTKTSWLRYKKNKKIH